MKRRHPGKGTGKGRMQNRGRQVSPEALQEITALLSQQVIRRDLLIEYLHLVQDHYGCITAQHLAALAEIVNIPMAAAYETASFYAHFDIIKEGEAVPAPVTVRVCDSIACQLRGAAELQQTLQEQLDPTQVRVVRAPCMGRCATAPVAEVGHRHTDNASLAAVQAVIAENALSPVIPNYQSYADYVAAGGYTILQECRSGERSAVDINAELKESGLRGMGGAGFPTATKWQLVCQHAGPRLMAVNADEGEPGTFKDRYFLEHEPHQFLEGMLIGAWAVEAQTVYIYLRDEYPAACKILLAELATLEDAGLIAPEYVELRRGAGAYVCGEESAMIESIEGKRGYPRQRPPYVAEVGLFGKPTLVNNVETLYWVPAILKQGAQWFASQGVNGSKGLRSYSVSGRVAEPGVKIAPAGTTLEDLIENYCGGMAAGHQLLGYLPGGASGGILPASKANLPLDFGALEEHGCFIGSAAIVVLSEQDDIRDVVLNLMRFFEDESCGQCTPCRSGTEKVVQLLESGNWDANLLDDLSQVMRDASICGLGQAAANPIDSARTFFAAHLIVTDSATGGTTDNTTDNDRER